MHTFLTLEMLLLFLIFIDTGNIIFPVICRNWILNSRTFNKGLTPVVEDYEYFKIKFAMLFMHHYCLLYLGFSNPPSQTNRQITRSMWNWNEYCKIIETLLLIIYFFKKFPVTTLNYPFNINVHIYISSSFYIKYCDLFRHSILF